MTPPSLRTGVASIDEEHGQLLAHEKMLSEICPERHEACFDCHIDQHAECNAKLIHVYDDLLGMVVDHFKSEERLMYWLPNELAEAHKQEHAELSGRLAGLMLQPNNGPVLMKPSALYEIVNQWLVEHITDWDMPLAKIAKTKD